MSSAASDNRKRLIIGLGTGRSGTTSLANLLNAQPSSLVVHEGGLRRTKTGRVEAYDRLLPWEKDLSAMTDLIASLERGSGNAAFYGSVSLYFLPYVHDIAASFPDAKFIHIVRSREEVVRSFYVHSEQYNWWMSHDGTHYRKDPVWDPSFPKIAASTKEAAIRTYYDLYIAEAARLEEEYPDRFATFDVKALNTPEGMREILDFAGYPQKNRVLTIMRDNSAYTPARMFKRWCRLVYLDRIYARIKRVVQ